MMDILSEANQLYQQALNDKATAYESLMARGLSFKTIQEFEVGYSESFCLNALKKNQERELKQVGLLNEKEFERNWDRLMFPIRDELGKMIGFNGRTQKKEDPVKYLLSPESLAFSKSHTLYNLHRAKEAIQKLDQVYLVEGVFDVMAMWQAGIQNVVCGLGTSLTLHQMEQIKLYTQNVTFGYDGDLAGFKASVLNARRLSQHMRKLETPYVPQQQIQFLMFPGESDPGDYFSHPKSLRQITNTPYDYLTFCRVKCELNPSCSIVFDQIKEQEKIKQERRQVKERDHASLLDQLDIVEVIHDYVPLKKSGKNYKGLCPFHEEKTPSFVVSPDKKIFKCFGCGEGGNVIEFVARHEKKSYRDTMRNLEKSLQIAPPVPSVPFQETRFMKKNTKGKDEEWER